MATKATESVARPITTPRLRRGESLVRQKAEEAATLAQFVSTPEYVEKYRVRAALPIRSVSDHFFEKHGRGPIVDRDPGRLRYP